MRYEVREGSQSAHCCFSATVVDTTKPHILADGKQYQDHCDSVCECFEVEDAIKICAALNAAESV